jgi:hypothetical protein
MRVETIPIPLDGLTRLGLGFVLDQLCQDMSTKLAASMYSTQRRNECTGKKRIMDDGLNASDCN